MKRTWLLVLLFIALGTGAYFASQYKKKAQTGTAIAPDMDFSIPKSDVVHKIFFADRDGRTVTLERTEDGWLYNKQFRARISAVESLMEVIEKVRVWYIPQVTEEPTIVKSLASEGIKVELYDKEGKALKVYYVGGVTGDETGTYMIMDGSEQPYVTHIPTMLGAFRVRFMFGEDDWKDRTVFREKPEDIQSISVEYPQQKSESFRLEKISKAEYDIKPYYSTTPTNKTARRKGLAEAYLLNFESLGAEAYETYNPNRDSVTALLPFAIVKLKKVSGEEKTVTFWECERVESNGKFQTVRYFTACDWGPFLLTQQLVFSRIFRGYNYFYEGNASNASSSVRQ